MKQLDSLKLSYLNLHLLAWLRIALKRSFKANVWQYYLAQILVMAFFIFFNPVDFMLLLYTVLLTGLMSQDQNSRQ